jgi:hypothetical protein
MNKQWIQTNFESKWNLNLNNLEFEDTSNLNYFDSVQISNLNRFQKTKQKQNWTN